MKNAFAIIGAIVSIVGIMLLLPLLYFVFGAFFGWVLWQVFPWAGQWLIDGMALFGIGVSLADLPLLTGTLAFIGAHFHGSSTSKSR